MDRVLLAGTGGFIGSVLRYWLSGLVQQLAQNIEFPYGTLAVNLLGCLVIGFLSELADARGVFTVESRVFFFVGILGGFTTFSSFTNETMNLLRDGEILPAITNVILQVVLGLSCVWVGRVSANLIWG